MENTEGGERLLISESQQKACTQKGVYVGGAVVMIKELFNNSTNLIRNSDHRLKIQPHFSYFLSGGVFH